MLQTSCRAPWQLYSHRQFPAAQATSVYTTCAAIVAPPCCDTVKILQGFGAKSTKRGEITRFCGEPQEEGARGWGLGAREKRGTRYRRFVQASAANFSSEIIWARCKRAAGRAESGPHASSHCKFSRMERLSRNRVANFSGSICRPVNSASPGNSGARFDVASRMLPCCKMAPRLRRWALPAIFTLPSMMSPGPRR